MTSADTVPSLSAALDLKTARLRANPAYELVLFDRLSDSERQALSEFGEDPDGYGLLRPRSAAGAKLSGKAVSRDTALLLYSLQLPGSLPRYVVRSMGDDCAATISRMVLDGILEIEVDGKMVSGPEAWALAGGSIRIKAARQENQSALAAISRRAIEYAAALGLDDAKELSGRLYAYNSIPASSRWRSLLPDDHATGDYLGLTGGAADRAMSRRWGPLSESAAWLFRHAATSEPESRLAEQAATACKLYVSPACSHLREAVQAVAEAVAESNAMQWKVGKGVHGLLRPDKMVVYFRCFGDLQETALRIMDRLGGCPPHGVPFTAELAERGLLSWGVDPTREYHNPAWSEAESWRGKLCDRLALALAQAGSSLFDAQDAENRNQAAPDFALERLRLEGIDTGTWTPSRGFAWGS